MSGPPSRYSDVRYLHAKRTVDDRALNSKVLESFREAVRGLPGAPRVLELGAGVGTMVSRLADLGCLTRGRYTLVDRDRDSLRSAGQHLGRWGGAAAGAPVEGRLSLRRQGLVDLEVELVQADLFDWLEVPARARYDAVVANAVLDLVDVTALLPLLWRRVGPGRPFWFSINFDGETIFLPELDGDAEVLRLYHRTMDQRTSNGRRAGESKTGRNLLQTIPASGASITQAGSSDWVVWPAGGAYPHDEAYFLHHIVATIDTALGGSAELDQRALAAWIAARHAQVDRGELIYIAHQLDVTGLAPA